MDRQEERFTFIGDHRRPEEIERHKGLIEKLIQRNIKKFDLKLSNKKKVNYKTAELKKMEFEDGSFLCYTDNKLTDRRFTVLTIHGCPGNHIEWGGLQAQMKQTVRWINIVTPGYDNLDERRGGYKGDIDSFYMLIIKLLQQLKIPKIIYCGHSMGGIMMMYFVTKYRDFVEGTINIAGAVHTWYIGLMTYYYFNVCEHEYNNKRSDKDLQKLNDDIFRKELTKRHNQITSKIWISKGMPYPQLNQFQLCSFIKIMGSYPNGMSSAYGFHRKYCCENITLYLYGRLDQLFEQSLIQELFYNVVYDEKLSPQKNPNFQKLYQSVKDIIATRCLKEEKVELDIQNLQSNFCFNFDDTGHNPHRRRPQQISKILKVYLIVCEQLQKSRKHLKETKLPLLSDSKL